MGVSGSGKSTLAAALADHLGRPFLEGDDVHPESNVAKMAAGTPLTDADRLPWLRRIRAWMDAQASAGRGGVVSCSALRRSYRAVLAGCPDLATGQADGAGQAQAASQRQGTCQGGDVVFLELDVPADVLRQRMTQRQGHFMPPSLLASQLATLEPLAPQEPGTRLTSAEDPARTLAAALDTLDALGAGASAQH